MEVLILGDGLLGTEIQKQTGWDLISRKSCSFDITEPEMFDWYLFGFYIHGSILQEYDVIVNCVANTDTYSKDKQKHWDVNYKGVIDLVDYCNEKGKKLIHISTDYVYTNSEIFTKETDIPIHGKSWYSYTKLLADAYVEAKSNNYIICRGTHKPKPFPHLYAWQDQYGNFDYVDVISNLIVKLITAEAKGIYNVGTEFKTMWQLAHQTNKDTLKDPKPDKVPGNVTMNIFKLKKFLGEL